MLSPASSAGGSVGVEGAVLVREVIADDRFHGEDAGTTVLGRSGAAADGSDRADAVGKGDMQVPVCDDLTLADDHGALPSLAS